MKDRLKKIKLLLLDVDGVLTDVVSFTAVTVPRPSPLMLRTVTV